MWKKIENNRWGLDCSPFQLFASMSSIKFTVMEDDSLFPTSQMSEPEGFSISLCVEGLLPDVGGKDYWFEVDMSPDDPEDEVEKEGEEEEMYEGPKYGLVKCYQQNPNPKNSSWGESKIPHPFPEEVFNDLKGKTFLVSPVQYGVNPWGKKVQIVFEG